MSGAHYEAEIERGGISVRVVVDFTEDARARYGEDVDETAERIGCDASGILRAIKARTDQAPF
jgi:hypothetical protein